MSISSNLIPMALIGIFFLILNCAYAEEKRRYKQRLLDIFPQRSQKPSGKYFRILDAMLSAIASTSAPPKNMFEKIMYVVRNPVLVRYFRSTYQQMLQSINTQPSSACRPVRPLRQQRVTTESGIGLFRPDAAGSLS